MAGTILHGGNQRRVLALSNMHMRAWINGPLSRPKPEQLDRAAGRARSGKPCGMAGTILHGGNQRRVLALSNMHMRAWTNGPLSRPKPEQFYQCGARTKSGKPCRSPAIEIGQSSNWLRTDRGTSLNVGASTQGTSRCLGSSGAVAQGTCDRCDQKTRLRGLAADCRLRPKP